MTLPLPPFQRFRRTPAWIVATRLSLPLIVLGLAFLATEIPRRLYYQPRCAAYAHTQRLTFLAYRTQYSGRWCVMADGLVSIAVVDAASPPTGLRPILVTLLYPSLVWLVLVLLLIGVIRHAWNPTVP